MTALRILRACVIFGVWSSVLTLPSQLRAQSGWLDLNWPYRNPVTISNNSGASLTNFQVKIALSSSSFDFTKAKSDGSDVRLTAGDGTTQIPFWIETWNTTSQAASLWVQVPSVPTSGSTIYLYYGNPAATTASNGNATFLFFDDFNSSSKAQGYWTLGSAQTELVQNQSWEDSAPHSLSVVKLNQGGHTYWGYYGLQAGCGGAGLAFSEDLVTWTKYSGNPLFTNARWPRVIQVGNTLYMAYSFNYCGDSQINLASSTDGINWTFVKTLVPADYRGLTRNQNPDLWLNPNDGRFYLYFYNGNDSTVFNIVARSATSPAGLDDSSADVIVLNSSQTLAAPDMMYYNGTYFLSTEIHDSNGEWAVRVYSSTTGPINGFSPLPGNPVLNNGAACMFQTPFGTTLHEYYCQFTNNTWTLQHRQADLTSARPTYAFIDSTKWTASGGTWSAVGDTLPNGTTGFVAQGNTSGVQILYSSFSGTDYIVEAFGKQLQGNVRGLAFRVNNPSNFYSINLYDNLNGTGNLYSYRWSNGNATQLGNVAVGTINAGTWNKLGVRVQGSSFDIYKDDAFQLHTTDSSIGSGGVGLYGENGTVANFTNVLVRKFAAMDPTSTVGSQQVATPALSSLTLNPTSVSGGSVNSTGTLTLTVGAPSSGAVVTLSNSNPSAVTIPASVTIAAGATSATFTVTSNPVTTTASSTITGTYNATRSATITVTPTATAVASITLNPNTVVGGVTNSSAIVTLNGTAPAGGSVVTLTSSNPAAAVVPASLTIPANAGSGTFVVTSAAVNSTAPVTITATFGGSQTATLTVTAPSAQSLTLSPTSLTGGLANSTGTVTLSSPAPSGGATVMLSSNNVSAATVPANVIVPAGGTTANFTVTTSAVSTVSTVTMTAAYNGTATATLTINPAPGPGTAAFVRAAGNFGGARYTIGIAPNAGDFLAVFVWQEEGATTPTVTDNLGSAYTLDCDLTYNQGFGLRRLSVYHIVNISSGITGVSVTPNQRSRGIVAEYSGMTSTAALDVCGTVNTQSSVTSWSSTATPTTTKDLVFGLADTGFTGNAGYSSSGPWNKRLEQGDPTGGDDSFVEDQMNLGAGSFTATGTTFSSVTNSSVVVAFTTNAAPVASLTLNPALLVGGGSSTGTVKLGTPAPSGGALVTLSSSNTAVATVPASVTVPATATSATFTVTTSSVTTSSTSSISATYSNSTKSATLTVNPTVFAAFVRAAGNFGNGAKYTIGIAPNAGDFLAVFVWQEEGATTPTVTDNLGSAYTLDCDLTYNQGFGLRRLSVYHIVNISSGITGLTVTPNQRSRGIVAEYSGMTSTAALDVCGTVNTQSSVTSWSSKATTTTTKDLVFGLADTGFTGNAGYSSSGPWNKRLEQGDPGGGDDSFVEDQMNLGAGSFTATGTTSSSVTNSSVVVAFRIQ